MVKVKKGKNKRLVLLDSHAILHRAYHALPDFTSSKGEPTGALYGLSSMLIKTINELDPDYIIACYDLPKPTFRHIAYDEYKAGRAKTDETLVSQIIRSRDIFKAFNVPIYEVEGFEADDLLGTIAHKVKKIKDLEVFIVSGDMDTLQLVDGKKVRVYTLRKGIKDTIIYDEDAVIERFGFGPKLLPDFKALRGDPSDNIIGIKGIGEKTASILIQKFGTIENLYKELKKSDKKFLKAGIKERIIGLLKEGKEDAEFSKMLAEIRRDALKEFKLPNKEWGEDIKTDNVHKIFTELGFRTLTKRFDESMGIETVEVVRQKSFLARQSLGVGGNESDRVIDERESERIGIALWLIDSSITKPTLDDILNFSKTTSFEVAKKKILKEIKEDGLEKVYKEIELPLISVVERMEERGIKIDVKYLVGLSKKYHTELNKIEKKIWKMAGEKFNINSPKQLSEILFDKLQLQAKNLKRTAGGARSTRESELMKLKEVHPIIDEILKHRELQKLLSTYIDNIPSMLDKKERLHTNLVQTGTTTGRMSSTNPNIQNIPIRTELGNAIRNAFISKKGFKIVSFDYSQIELRIASILSGDEKLMNIFKRGGDIHTAVASEIFGVSDEKVDKEMRRRAKIINFGILYGMGINSLRQSLGTTRAEAQKFYADYFGSFKNLQKYIEGIKKLVAKNGYTETFFGRRRYFEGINSHIPYIKAMAERMAINAPIQGTSADIIKLAMVRISEYLEKKNLNDKVFLLLQIHDELVFEIEEKYVDKVCPEIKKIMEEVLSLEQTKGVKLEVDFSVGDNWGEMKQI